jgi:thiamine transport system permease protein
VNRLPRQVVVALAVVPVAALLLLYAWPLATLVARVVGPGTIADTLTAPGVAATIWFTLWQAVFSTVLTLLVGLPVTWLLARWRVRGRRAVLAAVTVPFLLPTVVVGAAFAALLPDSWLGSVRAVLLAHVYFNVAVVVRVVGGLWTRMPHDLTAAAATLGAPPWGTFRRVTLPLLRPALLGAAGVVFVFTFTSFGMIRILGSPARPTLEVEIARRATQLGDVGGAAALSMVQLAALIVVVTVTARSQRRSTPTFAGRSGPQLPLRNRRRTLHVLAAVTFAVALIPIAAMVLRSLRIRNRWSAAGWRALVDPVDDRPGLGIGIDAAASIGLSLRAAAVAAVVATVIGGLAVLAITATQVGGRLLDAGLMLPLATSSVTLGLGMLITFDTPPIDWRAQWWFVPLGQALVAAPFVVRSLLPTMRSIPPDMRAAAATLGASPLRAWREIDLRVICRPLLAAGAFAAAISLGEFGATSVLSRTGDDTLPLAIDALLGRTGDLLRAQGFALATILFVLTALLVSFADPSTGDPLTEDRRARDR